MVTEYQQRVYDKLLEVPRGKVTTYGALAAAVHSSPRAVGQALRCNPFAPRVPCHRVVASDGSIGGFGGEVEGRKISEKVRLLESEGISFSQQRIPELGKVIHTWRIISPSSSSS